MALEAVVYQQALFDHKNDPNTAFHTLLQHWSWDFNLPNIPVEAQDLTHQLDPVNINNHPHNNPWESQQISPLTSMAPSFSNPNSPEPDARTPRRKRRRSTTTRTKKNKEQMETQRMTHIAVERNRRKQMNDYLSTLKSLMPESYLQRGDQASIVGAAINFVKELEQSLHSLTTAQKESPPFAEFFSFPQYSTMADCESGAKSSEVADVEVSMVEGHANLKIRSRKRPKQLLKLVTGLQGLKLSVLHLNVNTCHQFCLYSLSLKVEDDSKLSSVEEVATQVHELLSRIQEEAQMSC